MSQAPINQYRGNYRTANLMAVNKFTGEPIRDRLIRPRSWPRTRGGAVYAPIYDPYRSAKMRSVWNYPGGDLIVELERPQGISAGDNAHDLKFNWHSKRNLALSGIPTVTPPGTPPFTSLDVGPDWWVGATQQSRPAAGDTVLVKNQTDPYENAAYVIRAGAWDRVHDPIPTGSIIFIQKPGRNSTAMWQSTSRYPLAVTTFAGWSDFIVQRIDLCGCVKWSADFGATGLPYQRLFVTDGGTILVNYLAILNSDTGEFGGVSPLPYLPVTCLPIPNTDHFFVIEQVIGGGPFFNPAFGSNLARYDGTLTLQWTRPFGLWFFAPPPPSGGAEALAVTDAGDLICVEVVIISGLRVPVITRRSGNYVAPPTDWEPLDQAILAYYETADNILMAASAGNYVAAVSTGYVYLFDLSLTLIWQVAFVHPSPIAVCVDSTGVYVCYDDSGEDESQLSKLAIADGAVLWSIRYGRPGTWEIPKWLLLRGDELLIAGEESQA